MIAAAAFFRLRRDGPSADDLDVVPNLVMA